jgi:nucleoid-associated protein YgaU
VVRTDTPGAVASSPVVGWQWYEVGEKDTLYGIARRKLGSSRRWREIHDLNKSNLADPTKLRAGDKIKIPRNASGGDGERPNS